ncbi:MAG: hypothetical protein HQ492_00115 [Woeseiaceae bacterium]|nr:hypothetical protein [Woeseiaceae bacterium]
MTNHREHFEAPFLDFDFTPFEIASVREVLRMVDEDPDRKVRALFLVDPTIEQVQGSAKVCSLAEVVTARLNRAAQWYKLIKAEVSRQTPKIAAREIKRAHKAAKQILSVLQVRRYTRGHAILDPTLARYLHVARARSLLSLDGDAEEDFGRDVAGLVRIAVDLKRARRQLGEPEAVAAQAPSPVDEALDAFLHALERIWCEVIGRRAGTSVTWSADPNKSGKVGGPFVRFMVACARVMPGHETETASALRARWRRLHDTPMPPQK